LATIYDIIQRRLLAVSLQCDRQADGQNDRGSFALGATVRYKPPRSMVTSIAVLFAVIRRSIVARVLRYNEA